MLCYKLSLAYDLKESSLAIHTADLRADEYNEDETEKNFLKHGWAELLLPGIPLSQPPPHWLLHFQFHTFSLSVCLHYMIMIRYLLITTIDFI